jgi:hypothetical protein
MPPALKRRLGDDVRDSGRSLNDIAVGHLAAGFAVPFEPSGRASGRPTRDGSSVLLRMPAELKERLVRRAAERRQTVNELIVGTLCERLGLNGKEAMASNNGSSNGKTPSKDKVRVAIIGVGNCANSLLQGVQYYKNASSEDSVPGLMHVDLGGYHISDIEFVAAFDVVKTGSASTWPRSSRRRRARPTTSSGSSRSATSTSSSTTCPWGPRTRRSGTSSRC